MWRRSKEPRRISEVEGRALANLARVLMIASCFIYNNETTKPSFRQSLPEHLFPKLFCINNEGKLALTEIVPSSKAASDGGPPRSL